MLLFSTQEEYISLFKEELNNLGSQTERIQEYIDFQFKELDKIMEDMGKDNFWVLYPKLLGIDAKLTLLVELLSFEDFSGKEIIRIVESDYRSYFKELCGYDLSMKTKHSLIFNVT